MEGMHRKKRRKLGAGADEEATSDLKPSKVVKKSPGRRVANAAESGGVVGGAMQDGQPGKLKDARWKMGVEIPANTKSRGSGKGKVSESTKGAKGVASPSGGISSNWMKMKAEIASSSRRKGRPNGGTFQSKAAVMVDEKVEAGGDMPGPQPLGKGTELTKVVAMDCEMVGVGEDGARSILARVCLVNAHGNVLYDKHVQPLEHVTDYRTHVSGVRAKDLKKSGVDFFQVQKEVAALLKDRILVGHALQNDMQALLLSHPKRFIRDTSKYAPLRKHGRPRALRHLAEEVLGLRIQAGEHSPVDDARAALYIYLRHRKDWEQSLFPKNRSKEPKGKTAG